jgi:hypothetical protein
MINEAVISQKVCSPRVGSREAGPLRRPAFAPPRRGCAQATEVAPTHETEGLPKGAANLTENS